MRKFCLVLLVLIVLPLVAYGYNVERNVEYSRASGFWTSYPVGNESYKDIFLRKLPRLLLPREDIRLTMDIYTPDEYPWKKRPLLLLFHGGAFFTGNKEDTDIAYLCKYFASRGYVAVSVDYRLGFRPTPNEIQRAAYRAVQDANAAARYLLSRKDLNIDPDKIFTGGASAGAITALNLALMGDRHRPEITRGGWVGDEGYINCLPPDYDPIFRIRAVLNMWGAVHELEMLEWMDVPVISFHCINDPIVPYGEGYPFMTLLDFLPEDNGLFLKMYGSGEIHEYMQAHDRFSELYPYRGVRHTLFDEALDDIAEKAESFFSSLMDFDAPLANPFAPAARGDENIRIFVD